MKVKKISIKGWKSFSSKNGIALEGLKQINLIIGRNNTGKSNIFKYFFYLKSVTVKLTKDTKHYDLYHNITTSSNNKDTWAVKENDITCSIEFDDFLTDFKNSTFHLLNNQIVLKSHHYFKNKRLCLSLLNEKGLQILKEDEIKEPKIYSVKLNKYIEPLDTTEYRSDSNIYWFNFLESLVFF